MSSAISVSAILALSVLLLLDVAPAVHSASTWRERRRSRRRPVETVEAQPILELRETVQNTHHLPNQEVPGWLQEFQLPTETQIKPKEWNDKLRKCQKSRKHADHKCEGILRQRETDAIKLVPIDFFTRPTLSSFTNGTDRLFEFDEGVFSSTKGFLPKDRVYNFWVHQRQRDSDFNYHHHSGRVIIPRDAYYLYLAQISFISIVSDFCYMLRTEDVDGSPVTLTEARCGHPVSNHTMSIMRDGGKFKINLLSSDVLYLRQGSKVWLESCASNHVERGIVIDSTQTYWNLVTL